MTDFGERRRSQRVDAQLRMRMVVGAEGSEQTTDLETLNISTSGVYFLSDYFLAPMTKLALGLEVAVPGQAEGESDLALVQCQGLVVRVQPESPDVGPGPYEVAVFFTWIEPEGQAILNDHINLLMADG
ncbi:MAG: PilZ domain-containing protein [Candidatus Krumholzibacteriia bacterium]